MYQFLIVPFLMTYSPCIKLTLIFGNVQIYNVDDINFVNHCNNGYVYCVL